MAGPECFFVWKFDCRNKSEKLIQSGKSRIDTIIACSQVYADGKHEQLKNDLSENTDLTIYCHKSCVSSYTSKTNVEKFKKRQMPNTESQIPSKKTRLSLSQGEVFSFQQHCLFCGEGCVLVKDAKHPDRWRSAYLCREMKVKGDMSFKQAILKACTSRSDDWAQQVRLRVEGALSDLHAADARYHVDCRSKFMSPKSLASALNFQSRSGGCERDEALHSVIADLQDDKTRIWNSVELNELYRDHGGDKLSRSKLVKYLCSHFQNDLLVLSSAGVANIIVFRSKASSSLRLIDDDEDDLDAAITKVTDKIKADVHVIPKDPHHYTANIDIDTAIESTSNTLLELLATISTKLDKTLPAFLIGSMVTCAIHNHPTSLQVALGVLVQASKQLINQMYAFGVTCSYDEVLRFKKSAAHAATQDSELSGLSRDNSNLIQFVADNFDADISSQNGKLSTHSLALLMTQTENTERPGIVQKSFRRIDKSEMNIPIEYELEVQRYNGPKKPPMPETAARKSVPTLKVIVHTFLTKRRAEECDASFMQDIITKDSCPEFNGYNTSNSREQGQSMKPKTQAVYLPLIDMTPSDPDTMMTALARAQHLTETTRQKFVVFTCDLQLYRVAVHVIWAYKDRFSNVIMRLGGMHTMMSFVGAVGTLMAETGLAEILSAVFGGVSKMMTGKKFPQNVRALRMVSAELLRDMMEKSMIESKHDLFLILEELAGKSKTTKLWVDSLIKPVLIMMMFIRAEREGDWPLHLETFRMMMPYFFAAGHINYARYGLYYLRSMESMVPEATKHFLNGEHVMRHVPGIWNGIWSDMYIETTFMRYGHGKGGIIGITLKPETLKTWALSLHICGSLVSDLDALVGGEKTSIQMSHKEESKARIIADALDRKALRRKLDLCIDPLDYEKHPAEILNVASGRVGPSKVNVHDAVSIGRSQMYDFESSWPLGFHNTISKKVVTMAVTKKHVQIGEVKVFDVGLIYSRVIGLQASSRAVDINEVISHELAPIPASMFTELGVMRISKSKSALKKQMQVERSVRHAESSNVTIIDGSALLWVVNWPSSGTVRDYVNNLRSHLERHLSTSDVYLVFDRYYEYSTKSVTRQNRENEASRVHQLSLQTQLPAQNVVLTVAKNKQQLIEIICKELVGDETFCSRHTQTHKLQITGQDETPVEVHKGCVIKRRDLNTTHEEADVIIVQQMLIAAEMNPEGITVLSDDTDVFLLLLHFYLKENIQIPVTMEPTVRGRTAVDIGRTVEKHKDIIPNILAAHALSGCDTVACCFGIGKGTVLKILQSGKSLSLLGHVDAIPQDVIDQSTEFITACYGQSNCETMSAARLKFWAARTGKSSTSMPKLCSLPPTSAAFAENVKRAHYQTCVWLSVKHADPPALDPERYGWKRDNANRLLCPITLPDDVPLAPDFILRLIKCGCQSDTPCSSLRCGCFSANLPCTLFCACRGDACLNDQM